MCYNLCSFDISITVNKMIWWVYLMLRWVAGCGMNITSPGCVVRRTFSSSNEQYCQRCILVHIWYFHCHSIHFVIAMRISSCMLVLSFSVGTLFHVVQIRLFRLIPNLGSQLKFNSENVAKNDDNVFSFEYTNFSVVARTRFYTLILWQFSCFCYRSAQRMSLVILILVHLLEVNRCGPNLL